MAFAVKPPPLCAPRAMRLNASHRENAYAEANLLRESVCPACAMTFLHCCAPALGVGSLGSPTSKFGSHPTPMAPLFASLLTRPSFSRLLKGALYVVMPYRGR